MTRVASKAAAIFAARSTASMEDFGSVGADDDGGVGAHE